MLEAIFLPMDGLLDRSIDLDIVIEEDYHHLHQAEEAVGLCKLYEPKIAEYATVMKRLRDIEYSLKLAKDRKVIFEAKLEERDKALDIVKTNLSSLSQVKNKLSVDFQTLQSDFDLRLAQTLQARIDEGRSTAVKEIKDSPKYKDEIDRSYNNGTENAFLEFARRLKKYPDVLAI